MTPFGLFEYIFSASCGLLILSIFAAAVYAGFWLLRLNLIAMTTPKEPGEK